MGGVSLLQYPNEKAAGGSPAGMLRLNYQSLFLEETT
jgi:hypothetical protein